MRVIKKLLKWLGLALVLGIALLIVLPWFPVILDKFAAKKQTAYLTANSQALDLSKAGGDFSFDEAFYNNRLFMLGEMHGYARVQDLDLALLAHLNSRLGVRHYMAEIDPAAAMIFNHALRTGDDAAMLSVFKIWHDEKKSQWGNLDFLDKIRAIRGLNETLPEAQKIYFIGVDGPPRADFVAIAETLPPIADNPIRELNAEILTASLSREAKTGRYSHILRNIKLMDKAFPEAKFYGLWGTFHIHKIGINGDHSLSHYLNTGTEKVPAIFKDKVATLTTLCVADCSNMMPSGAFPGIPSPKNGELYTEVPMSFDNTYLFRTRGIGAAKAVMGEVPNMVFDMNNAGSPYMDGSGLAASTGYMSMMQNFQMDGSAAENFDALILMNGSDALRPLEGNAFVFAR